ncbi:MAG: hypothetical protein ACK443_10470 [Methylococcaceae bacterium]|jgi:hypothetical protein
MSNRISGLFFKAVLATALALTFAYTASAGEGRNGLYSAPKIVNLQCQVSAPTATGDTVLSYSVSNATGPVSTLCAGAMAEIMAQGLQLKEVTPSMVAGLAQNPAATGYISYLFTNMRQYK